MVPSYWSMSNMPDSITNCKRLIEKANSQRETKCLITYITMVETPSWATCSPSGHFSDDCSLLPTVCPAGSTKIIMLKIHYKHHPFYISNLSITWNKVWTVRKQIQGTSQPTLMWCEDRWMKAWKINLCICSLAEELVGSYQDSTWAWRGWRRNQESSNDLCSIDLMYTHLQDSGWGKVVGIQADYSNFLAPRNLMYQHKP